MDKTVGHITEYLGPYELWGELGRGAMARVWRAWDPNLEREVAIKEPLFDASLPQETLDEMGRRFVAEGRAAARLNHPNIVAIHAADVYDGRPAIVMELVDGTTLTELLNHGALAPHETLSILDQLLDAIGHAHENGIVHRDIKPDNIFVSSKGNVKLADFGIAHVADSGATRATMVGTVLGTPGYMSPEQATGKAVDARSDIFSIGTVAYEMLAGGNPFGAGDGTDATTLIYRIVHEPAPALPDSAAEGLPVDLRPAVMAALSKNPVDRPQSAAEFKAMLHGQKQAPIVTDNQVLSDAVEGKRGTIPKWAPYAAVAAVAAVVLIGTFVAANSGTNGGMGQSQGATVVQEQKADNVQTSESSEEQTTASTSAPSDVYLGVYDNHVAVFKSSQSDPYRITEIPVRMLEPETAAKLGAGVACESLDDALSRVDTYIEEMTKLQEQERENTVTQENEVAVSEPTPESGADSSTESQNIDAFWGVWIGAGKEYGEAQSIAYEASQLFHSFGVHIVLTTDYENLNPEPWYVVSVGSASGEEEAYEICAEVVDNGYPDAYVKYTGNKR